MATRSVIIPHDLGMNNFSEDFEALAGKRDERTKTVQQITEQIKAFMLEQGGRITREGTLDTMDDIDDDGNEILVSDIGMDFEFIDEATARRAGETVRESFSMYGVLVHDLNADKNCRVTFTIPGDQQPKTVAAIETHVKQLSEKYGAELLNSEFACNNSILTYQFDSPDDLNTVFDELAKIWGPEQVTHYIEGEYEYADDEEE